MMIDDLIEKLYELKKEYGEREVILYTQMDLWLWDVERIEKVYYTEEDGKIVIQGKGKKTEDQE